MSLKSTNRFIVSKNYLVSVVQLLCLSVLCLGCNSKGDNCIGESCSGDANRIGVEPVNIIEDAIDPASQQSTDAVEEESVPIVVVEVEPEIVVEPKGANTIAAKNYLQLNNTYSSITGIPTNEPRVLEEYSAIIMQLPTSSNPESLNGFNQIAQARLAFAYCYGYIENHYEQYRSLSDGEAIQVMLNSMVDVDIVNNVAHENLYQNLMEIMSDNDQLIDDEVQGDSSEGEYSALKRKKLFELSCTALLASSYVSMI